MAVDDVKRRGHRRFVVGMLKFAQTLAWLEGGKNHVNGLFNVFCEVL